MSRFEPLLNLLDKSFEVEEIPGILLLKKFDWDYNNCLMFQNHAREFVHDHRDLKVFIFCNHPPVYTNGRGNQRDMQNVLQSNLENLDYPLHQIFRGGGLTFHHDQQFIFYPIVALHSTEYTLNDHLCFFFKSFGATLKECYSLDSQGKKNPLGIWLGQRKIASIGVGLKRYVTFHGLAFNLNHHAIMDTLDQLNPCGLSGKTYITLEECIQTKTSPEEFFKNYKPFCLEQAQKELSCE